MNDTTNWAIVISLANFALTWGVALYMYLANKNKVTNERIQTLEDDLDERLGKLKDDQADHAIQVARLEENAKNNITKTELDGIFSRLNGISREVSEMKGDFQNVKTRLEALLTEIMRKGLNNDHG